MKLLPVIAFLLCAACTKDANADSQTEPGITAITLSATELTFMSSGFEQIRIYVEPADAGITANDLALVNTTTGKASAYVAMEHNDGDEGSFSMTIRDKGTGMKYQEQVKVVCTKAKFASGPLTVRSAPYMPVVYVTSESPVTSKSAWVKGTIRIDGGNKFEDLAEMVTEIKGRGNTTWNWMKKPYALKLDSKKEVLGMPSHKRWCLIANFMDRTHLRNRLAYYLGQHSKLAWTARNEYVELYFNGAYQGMYLLTEQIKEDPNRINITKLKKTDIEGDAVTGGYLLEIDSNWDEEKKFESSGTRQPVNIKYPDPEDLTQQQFDYIQSYFNMADNTIKAAANGNTQNGMFNYFDEASLIDYWIIYELMSNHEPLNPKSVYFYKDRSGPLVAGPIWDFDWGTLKPDRVKSWQLYGKVNKNEFHQGLNWWNIFLKDSDFRAKIKARWTEWYPFLQTVPQFIDQEQTAITAAESRNIVKWPKITGLYLNNNNGDENLSFPNAVARLRQAYVDHLEWMNGEIMKW